MDAADRARGRGWIQPRAVRSGRRGGPDHPALVARRVHTTRCTNFDNGTVSSFSACADGCGANADEAEELAKAALSIDTCLGSQWGCCQVETDQNFNVCGY